MSPYEFAQAIADDLRALTLPTPILPQVGEIVIDCAGTWVSVTNIEERDVFNSAACGLVEMADVQLVSAFECSITSDDEGLTDPTKLDEVSKQMDAYGVTLAGYARNFIKGSFVEGTFNGITFNNTGGLGIVTVSVTVPVP